jgi:hypothetical protein
MLPNMILGACHALYPYRISPPFGTARPPEKEFAFS